MTRSTLTYLALPAAVLFSNISPAASAEPICNGHSAILAAWNCGDGSTGTCYLWGVDKTRAGKWGKESRFVIEDSVGHARLVDFLDACKNGRCSRAEMAVCSTPVARGERSPSELEKLLAR